jgi:hypothetical protein
MIRLGQETLAARIVCLRQQLRVAIRPILARTGTLSTTVVPSDYDECDTSENHLVPGRGMCSV